MTKTSVIWTTDHPYPSLPLLTEEPRKQYFITANNKAGEMEWQQQALDEDELIELIDQAHKEELRVEVEPC